MVGHKKITHVGSIWKISVWLIYNFGTYFMVSILEKITIASRILGPLTFAAIYCIFATITIYLSLRSELANFARTKREPTNKGASRSRIRKEKQRKLDTLDYTIILIKRVIWYPVVPIFSKSYLPQVHPILHHLAQTFNIINDIPTLKALSAIDPLRFWIALASFYRE